jgi:probable HAF family extracellular repeat protein
LYFTGSPSFVALLLMRKPDGLGWVGLFQEMRATRIAGPSYLLRASKEIIMKSLRRVFSRNVAFIALVCVAVCQPAIAQRCGLEDLGTLAGGTDSYASAINNRGQVVGYSTIAATGLNHAFLYERHEMFDLGTLPGGNNSEALAINDRGQIVGDATTSTLETHAILYEEGRMHDLGTLPGGLYHFSYATGINSQGQIVGHSSTASGNLHSFLYEHGVMHDLGALPDEDVSAAAAINDRGQIVGSSDTGLGRGPLEHPFLYEKGVMMALGVWVYGQPANIPTGINDRGEIVGYSDAVTSFVYHAFLYRDGLMVDLGTLPGALGSVAWAINNRGQAVGEAELTVTSRGVVTSHGVLFERGKIVDLGTFPDGDNSVAMGINDYGQVVGSAGTASGVHAVLWHPVEDGYRREGDDKCHDDKHDDER